MTRSRQTATISTIGGDGREASAVCGERLRDLALEVTRLTRAAYAMPDPVPGLDLPDGANEPLATVQEQLASGIRIWTARDGLGHLVGCLRVTRYPHGDWEIHRVAVSPSWRGGGIARRLLTAVAAEAEREQARQVWLNAVVERCLPPLYATMGYRPTVVFAAADKPLTEWRMDLHPRTPCPRRWYADIDADAAWFLCWFVVQTRLVAVLQEGVGNLDRVLRASLTRLLRKDPDLRGTGIGLAGVDTLPGDAVDRLPERLGAIRRKVHDIYRLSVRRCDSPFHRQPRAAEPEALALCRFAPGREPLMDSDQSEGERH